MPDDTSTPLDDELEARTAKVKQGRQGRGRQRRGDRPGEASTRRSSSPIAASATPRKRIEKAVREGVETIRTQSEPYRENATQQIDEAQKYVVERIKERPVMATLAGLGVGLLLGLLMASRSDK